MARKSLHEIKMEERLSKKGQIITDMDYFLRDKDEERVSGTDVRNTLDMTPPEAKPKTKVVAQKAE